MDMVNSSKYQIAERDELEAFGREEDTSAALGPNDDVDMRMADAASSSSKRRVCVCVALALLSVAGIGIFLAVFFGTRNQRGSNGTQQPNSSDEKQPPGVTPNGKATPDAVPVSVPPATTAPPASTVPPLTEVPTYTISVVSKMPHDEEAFTQGLEYNPADGKFYESTGLYRRSTLRRVNVADGAVEQRYNVTDQELFGEGITLHKDEHIFMLTWKSGRGFIFNQSTFELIKEWKYEGQGWGLTMDRANDEVWMSDGTADLRVLDPETMSEKRRIAVTLRGEKVSRLNELEWICGEVWANVWQTRSIYRINPQTGFVTSIVDADELPLNEDITQTMDVLNGIAVDHGSGRLWLTGKLWKKVYQVTVSDSSLDIKSCK